MVLWQRFGLHLELRLVLAPSPNKLSFRCWHQSLLQIREKQLKLQLAELQ